MTTHTHETHVAAQFGPQAAAYVTSAVHAAGADLEQIAAVAERYRPARVLDLGCGGGHAGFHVAPHARDVVAFDLSSDMLGAVAAEAARRGLTNITTQQGSVAALPFADASFDFVVTRFSAHHWHDLDAGLWETRRVLRSGGVAVFADTVSPAAPLLDTHLQAIELLRDPSHVRNYSVAEWTARLKAAGFAPGEPTLRRLRLDFASWVARMATPAPHVAVLRALQKGMPTDAAAYFELEADGSFTVDKMLIEAQ